MTRPDIAAIAFALRILLHERHRGALLRMALGAPWTGLERVAVSDDAKPRRAAWTRYRPTPRKGAVPPWSCQQGAGSVVARACSREFQNTLLHSL